MAHKDMQTQVLIVGAGPVGLTLAMDLAQRGIAVVVAETRRYGEPPNVKCNHVAARTMEQFRRLGVAQKIRDAGLPADYPNDASFCTSLTGVEFSRIPIPCRRDRYTDTNGPDGWWPTPEPAHRINQIYLEPILLDHAAAQKNVTVLNRTQLMSFEQADGQVTAELTDLETQATFKVSAHYLIGCDGGRSGVRKQMGAQFEGTAIIQRVQSTYIHAPGLRGQIKNQAAWACYVMNPRRCGTVFSIDGKDNWLIHNHLSPDEPEFDSVNRDWCIRQILGVDDVFGYEVLSKEDWVGRRLVSNRFRNAPPDGQPGRVFLAGDAAHIWMPYAGYGMNAGIADALNLGWLLAAHLQGWASEAILNAYEAERQPITEQVSKFAMNHAQQMIKMKRAVPHNIEEPGAVGDAVRADMGQAAYALNVQQFCAGGLNFGYFYQGSPIIVPDAVAHLEPAPAYTMGDFTPSTVPGCRAPHFWLVEGPHTGPHTDSPLADTLAGYRAGQSLYDHFGPAYTLLRFDAQADIRPLLAAATARQMPLAVMDLPKLPSIPSAYQHKLVLCRADQHVVWRGDALPADAAGLVATLCGDHAAEPLNQAVLP